MEAGSLGDLGEDIVMVGGPLGIEAVRMGLKACH